MLFTNARPGVDDAAFIKRSEPRRSNTPGSDLVRGYYVRTRAGVPLQTVGASDARCSMPRSPAAPTRLNRLPADRPERPLHSDFVAELPAGGVARCNFRQRIPRLPRRGAPCGSLKPRSR
jgi:hypothetical protein